MRILHLLSQRPECTGSGIYLQAVIRRAQLKGHRNHLLAGIPGKKTPLLSMIPGKDCDFVRFEGEDLPFPVVGMSDVMPYRSRRFSSLSPAEVDDYQAIFAEKLKRAKERFRPHLIHSHHLWLMTATARKLFPEIPMVTTCHGTDLRQYVNCPHLRKRVEPFVKQLDHIMALSRPQAREIGSLFNISQEKIEVVGGGYDNTLFTTGKKNAAPPVELLYAGKFSKSKGVPWLLKSLFRIQGLPWRLHMAGSAAGKEMDLCMELAGRLGDRVVIHGALSHDKLSGLMRASHIFVLPSFFEGLPLVLLEALASGCRIVTTSLPGTREVLGAKDGEFVRIMDLPPLEGVDEPFEEDEPRLEEMLATILGEEIGKAVENPSIDISAAAKITDRYTWPAVYERIESVYEKALGQHAVSGNGKRPMDEKGEKMSSEQSQNSHFDAVAATWDENPLIIKLTGAVSEKIAAEIPLDSTMTAMEFGCGTGLVSIRLAPELGRIFAVDNSDKMLEVLQQKIDSGFADNITIYRSGPGNEMLPDQSFSLVFSNMAMHHIDDVEAQLKAFHDVLSPGGYIAVSDLDTEDGSFHGDMEGIFHHGFSRKQFMGMLEKAGFGNCRIQNAHVVEKEDSDGKMRAYSVFLATGQKG